MGVPTGKPTQSLRALAGSAIGRSGYTKPTQNPRRPSGEAETESSSVFRGCPRVPSTHQGVAASSSGVLALRVRTPASSISASDGYHMSELLKVSDLRAKSGVTPRRSRNAM